MTKSTVMKQWLPLLLALAVCISCNNNKDGKTDKPKTDTTATAEIKGDNEAVTTGDDQPITGRWKPVEFNIKDMSEEEKKAMIENVVLEFTTEGNFNAYNKDQKQEGTYTYKDNKLELINKSSTKTDRFTIGWESGTMLMINEEGTVKLVKQ